MQLIFKDQWFFVSACNRYVIMINYKNIRVLKNLTFVFVVQTKLVLKITQNYVRSREIRYITIYVLLLQNFDSKFPLF